MRKTLFLLLLLGAGSTAFADTLYVQAQANIPLASGPGAEASVIGRLTPGDAVTVLEREAEYVRIETSYGTQGWLNQALLTDAVPAAERVNTLEQELDVLRQQLADSQASLRNTQAALRQAQQATSAARSAGEGQVDALESENASLRASLEAQESRNARLQQQVAEREMALEAGRLLAASPASVAIHSATGWNSRQVMLSTGLAFLLAGIGVWAGAAISRRRLRQRYHGMEL